MKLPREYTQETECPRQSTDKHNLKGRTKGEKPVKMEDWPETQAEKNMWCHTDQEEYFKEGVANCVEFF